MAKRQTPQSVELRELTTVSLDARSSPHPHFPCAQQSLLLWLQCAHLGNLHPSRTSLSEIFLCCYPCKKTLPSTALQNSMLYRLLHRWTCGLFVIVPSQSRTYASLHAHVAVSWKQALHVSSHGSITAAQVENCCVCFGSLSIDRVCCMYAGLGSRLSTQREACVSRCTLRGDR